MEPQRRSPGHFPRDTKEIARARRPRLPARSRPRRRQARQLIRHGHWTINGRRVDIPSYQVRENDVIAIKMDFDYPDPGKAQAVMQSYVTQFMRMNSDQIEDQALDPLGV